VPFRVTAELTHKIDRNHARTSLAGTSYSLRSHPSIIASAQPGRMRALRLLPNLFTMFDE
jgi:hypothetical protein